MQRHAPRAPQRASASAVSTERHRNAALAAPRKETHPATRTQTQQRQQYANNTQRRTQTNTKITQHAPQQYANNTQTQQADTRARSKTWGSDRVQEKRHAASASLPNRRCSRDVMPTHNKKCSHGIWQHWCKQCGGSGICEHNRNRYACKECKDAGKTSSLCEHNVYKYHCAQCGTNKCQHGNNKNTCRQCGKTRTRTLCPHGKRKDKKTIWGEPACSSCRDETQQEP
jgi:hypothetical protein